MVVLRAVDVEKTRIDAMGNEPVRTCAREVRTDSAVTSLPEEGVNTAAQSGSSVKVASSQSISRLHRSRTGRPADMKSEIARIYGQLSYSAAPSGTSQNCVRCRGDNSFLALHSNRL